MFFHIRYLLWVSSVILIPQEEMVKMEIEVQMILLAMVAIIPVDLVVDVAVPLVPKVMVMVVLQMILIEVVQIVPPLSLEDNVDMITILNNKVDLKRV